MLLLRGATSPSLRSTAMNPVSIHAPLARSNPGDSGILSDGVDVSIHAPLARSNFVIPRNSYSFLVSIHAPLARSNHQRGNHQRRVPVSIHAPLARSNNHRGENRHGYRCFNTCSSCEEQHTRLQTGAPSSVSIHAPLARSNSCEIVEFMRLMFQYMLLLRGATFSRSFSSCVIRFQYMLLLRGATAQNRRATGAFCFNTCSSCEEQLSVLVELDAICDVSIHAPLARSNMMRW